MGALLDPPGRFPALTLEWCIRMAQLEAGCEIGAGRPDHPLRTPLELTPDMQLYVAQNFEEHMRPDVTWIDDPRFAQAFQTFLQEIPVSGPEAAYTIEGPAYPAYVSAKLSPDGGAMVLTVRANPDVDMAAETVAVGATATIEILLDAWDAFVAQVTRVRWAPADLDQAMADPDGRRCPVPHRPSD